MMTVKNYHPSKWNFSKFINVRIIPHLNYNYSILQHVLSSYSLAPWLWIHYQSFSAQAKLNPGVEWHKVTKSHADQRGTVRRGNGVQLASCLLHLWSYSWQEMEEEDCFGTFLLFGAAPCPAWLLVHLSPNTPEEGEKSRKEPWPFVSSTDVSLDSSHWNIHISNTIYLFR